MARNEAPPFARGKTWYGGGTIDTANYDGVWLEGKEYLFEDTTYGTGMYVTCRIVRNVGAAALRPKRAVSFAAGYYGRRVDGYTTVTGQAGFIVDEFLPAAGVPVGDLFWIVTRGPTLIKTDLAGGANNPVNEGDPLHALTAATSGATTAGRLYTAATTGATTAVPVYAMSNVIARAMTARTTANTDSDTLAYVTGNF